jgi:hypothetical protein
VVSLFGGGILLSLNNIAKCVAQVEPILRTFHRIIVCVCACVCVCVCVCVFIDIRRSLQRAPHHRIVHTARMLASYKYKVQLYSGAIKAPLRRYQGAIKALPRLY